ncbi:MAG: flagellar hook-length control protein FliK [Selenomonadaceae bacterium]|nr:flagellar hook-length control protein FliK [Selenomonadaceae bacterium]
MGAEPEVGFAAPVTDEILAVPDFTTSEAETFADDWTQANQRLVDLRQDSTLQSLLPQSGETAQKGQTMLDVLSGKTYPQPGQQLQTNGRQTVPTPLAAANEGQAVNVATEAPWFTVETRGNQGAQMAFPVNSELLRFNANVSMVTTENGAEMPEVLTVAPEVSLTETTSADAFLRNINQSPNQNVGSLLPNQVETVPNMPEITPREVLLTAEAEDIPTAPQVEVPTANLTAASAVSPREVTPNAAVPDNAPENRADNFFDFQRVPVSDAVGQDLRQSMGNNQQNFGTDLGRTNTGAEIAPRTEANGQNVAFANFQQTLTETQATPENPPVNQPTRDTFEIQRQIVEQARLLRTEEGTEMVIRLKPEHLGDLTLRISVTVGGAVNASFHSENAYVRTIIDNSLAQLRQELNNQGIKVDNVEVSAQLPNGQMPEGQGQWGWEQARQAQGQGGNVAGRDGENYEDAAENLVNATNDINTNYATTDGGVDYRV